MRSIDPTEDDLSSYLNWMKNTEQNQFILSTNKNMSLLSLISYVTQKNEKIDAIFFGIFDKSTKRHVGNIKLEPIVKNDSATMGILIGEPTFRGSGVGFEVIVQILRFAKKELGLKKINLGVDVKNSVAMRLYSKCGFVTIESSLDDPKNILMEVML